MEYKDKKPSNIYIIHTKKVLLRQLLKSGDSMHMSDSKKACTRLFMVALWNMQISARVLVGGVAILVFYH